MAPREPNEPLDIAAAVECHRTVQEIMRRRRVEFLAQSVFALPRRWVANRFRLQLHRNRFEVHRLWERATDAAVRALIDASESKPRLRAFPARLLIDDVPAFRALVGSADGALLQVLNDHVEKLRQVWMERTSFRDACEDWAAATSFEREYAFMHFMLSTMDDMESCNKVPGSE